MLMNREYGLCEIVFAPKVASTISSIQSSSSYLSIDLKDILRTFCGTFKPAIRTPGTRHPVSKKPRNLSYINI